MRSIRRLLPRVLAVLFVATGHLYLPPDLAIVLTGIVLILLALDGLPAEKVPGPEALPQGTPMPR